MAPSFKLSYNGTRYAMTDVNQLLALILPENVDVNDTDVIITFSDIDVDGMVDFVTAFEYSYSEIISVKQTDNNKWNMKLSEGVIPLDYENSDIEIITADNDGNVLSASDFSEGDIVAYCTDTGNDVTGFGYIRIIKLTGYVFNNADGKNTAFIVTDYGIGFSDKTGLSIVTDLWQTTYNGEDAITVKYIKDETEGEIIFTDDSRNLLITNGIRPDELAVGDVFDVAETRNGVVGSYAVLGKIDKNGILKVYTEAFNEYSENNEFVFGYIANNKHRAFPRGEVIDIIAGSDCEEPFFILKEKTNKYSYAPSYRKPVISGDFMGGESTDYFDNDTATMVFLRIIDGNVKDIYSFNTRVDISSDAKASINGEPIETIYQNNDTGMTKLY